MGLWLGGCGKPASPESALLEAEALRAQFAQAAQAHADPAQCRECHRAATEGWEGSHHHLANAGLRAADSERIAAAGEGVVKQRGMRWHDSADGWELRERDAADERLGYPVIGSIGWEPLIQYLHVLEDGRIQAHDVAWDVEKGEWFSVFEAFDESERQRGEWGHWTGQGMNWDANCAYCHMTEYRKGYQPETDRYEREWTAMGITCAQCHPDMRVHLSQVRNGNNQFEESLTPAQVMDYCASCHSLREELTPEPLKPGDPYADHYLLSLAARPGLYHADGQVIGENYVYGSLRMSRMGHAGVTCLDCHDPHSTKNLLAVEDNSLCMRCHGTGERGATKIDALAHSHHPADSTGNRCVECHMPVMYFMGRDGRRDHSFSTPDPLLTRTFGIPNTCTACHDDKDLDWSLAHAEAWYGADYNAQRRARARLLTAVWEGTAGAEAIAAAYALEENAFWRATYLELLGYTAGGEAAIALRAVALRDADPLVRTAAVRLAGMDGLEPAARAQLSNDPLRVVRLSAAVSTSGMPVNGQQGEAELKAYLRNGADTPMGALRWAAYLDTRGERTAALAAVSRMPELEPLNAEAWRMAAVELHRLGATAQARAYLQRSEQRDPRNAATHFNRALLEYEAGFSARALEYFESALAIEPLHEDAWYNLIVLHLQQGEREAAALRLEEALRRLPTSARLLSLQPYLRQP